MSTNDLIIDDRSSNNLRSSLGTEWRLVTDNVMGGVSSGSISLHKHQGKDCLRMQGNVSTQNNGGFVQIALDLTAAKRFDASAYNGIELEVAGNNEDYNIHLRTSDLRSPWQSYRSSFTATKDWQNILIPFITIEPYRTTKQFRRDKLKRIGLVAIGRDFKADLCVAGIRFYTTN